MAAGSRLQAQVMDFFFLHLLFKHALCSKVKGFRPTGIQALPSPRYPNHIIFNIALWEIPTLALICQLCCNTIGSSYQKIASQLFIA